MFKLSRLRTFFKKKQLHKTRFQSFIFFVTYTADIDQVHGGASARREGRTEANLWSHNAGPHWCNVDASVEAAAVRRRVPTYHRPGTGYL